MSIGVKKFHFETLSNIGFLIIVYHLFSLNLFCQDLSLHLKISKSTFKETKVAHIVAFAFNFTTDP